MGGWWLSVLLTSLTVCCTTEVLEKTLGSEPDDTPLCPNSTVDFITLIVCKISTERTGGKRCLLLYRHRHDFETNCSSSFKLLSQNQTVFLHLSSLTTEDSGNFTCDCSYGAGTNTVHLNVNVSLKDLGTGTALEASIPIGVTILLASVTIVVMISAVILGLRIRHSRGLPEHLSTQTILEPPDIEPYSTFMQKENGLYSIVEVRVYNSNTNNSNMFTRN